MESITLQLRQEESTNVQQNGVYDTTLAYPIELRAGDEVSIKSVFLDTTDVIHIPPEGLPVSLTGMKYLVNYNINQSYDYQQGAPIGVQLLSTYGFPAGLAPSPPVAPATGDNSLYWLSEAFSSTNHSKYYVQNVNVFPKTKGQRKGKRYGGVDIPIQFTDPRTPTESFKGRGTLHVASYEIDRFSVHNPIPIPSQDRKDFPTEFITFTCADVADVKEIRVEPGFPLFEHNIDRVEFVNTSSQAVQPIQPGTNTYIMYPQYFTWTATIPGGDYTPTEIAATLNDLLTPLEYNGSTSANYNIATGAGGLTWDGANTKFPTQSPFLTTILQNDQELIAAAAADGEIHEQVFINASRKDLTDPTQLAANAGTFPRKFELATMKDEYLPNPFRPPVDRFCGTNQISMSFDDAERKLKWDLLHFPVYTNSSVATGGTVNNDAKPGVQYNEMPYESGETDYNGDSGLAKAYSGIAFTAMSPPSFWSEQLGFTKRTVSVQQNVVSCDFPIDALGVPNSFQVHNVLAGETITEAAATITIPVVQSSAPQYVDGSTNGPPGEFARPIFTDGIAGTGSQVSTDDTVACFASKTYNDAIQTAGYFLVDVAHNFNTTFVGGSLGRETSGPGSAQTTGNDTMSVVSRYYTSNNFVSDQGAGSIVYTHSGAPQNLTDLAIRVKNPDGSFVADTVLGEQNSVFISINRAKKIHNITSLPQPKEEDDKDK